MFDLFQDKLDEWLNQQTFTALVQTIVDQSSQPASGSQDLGTPTDATDSTYDYELIFGDDLFGDGADES